MQKKLLVFFLVVLVLAVVGIIILSKQKALPTDLPLNTNTDTNQSTPVDATDSQGVISMGVALLEVDGSGQFGSAEIIEEGGKLKVTINVEGATSASPQPAHIHLGFCPTPGEVKYPLTNVVNGKSETIIDATMADIVPELPLAVNVHKSTTEMSTYLSCGDLPDPSAAE